MAMQESLDSAASSLDTLVARARSHLETEIRADVPTGDTPRKRVWPELGDNAADAALDLSRSQALQVLRPEGRPAPSPPTVDAPIVPPPMRDIVSSVPALAKSGTAVKRALGLRERSPNTGAPALNASVPSRKYSC